MEKEGKVFSVNIFRMKFNLWTMIGRIVIFKNIYYRRFVLLLNFKFSFHYNIWFRPGILGMANKLNSHTNGSQFYITMSALNDFD